MPTVSVISLDQDTFHEGELLFESSLELGRPIFDQIEEKGLKLPHGCLAGSCGSCIVVILDGADYLKAASAVESDTVAHLQETGKISIPVEKSEYWVCRLSCRAKIEKEGLIRIGLIQPRPKK